MGHELYVALPIGWRPCLEFVLGLSIGNIKTQPSSYKTKENNLLADEKGLHHLEQIDVCKQPFKKLYFFHFLYFLKYLSLSLIPLSFPNSDNILSLFSKQTCGYLVFKKFYARNTFLKGFAWYVYILIVCWNDQHQYKMCKTGTTQKHYKSLEWHLRK